VIFVENEMVLLSSLTTEELLAHVDTLDEATDLEKELAVRLAMAVDALSDMEKSASPSCTGG
jgi:hypothetical protein